MPKLKAIYDNLDDVDSAFHGLYEERGGKFHLTGIEGIKTDADISRIQRALDAEKTAHKATKAKLEGIDAYGDLDEIKSKLDKYDELEAKAATGGGGKPEEIAALVDAKVKAATAKAERDLAALKKERDEAIAERDGLKGERKTRIIHDAVRKAAAKAKVLESAVEDALLFGERIFELDDDGNVLAKDGVGVTPKINPEEWFKDLTSAKPHWFGASAGGGAPGGKAGGAGTGNPWSKAGWNATEQANLVRTDKARAERLAAAAGSKIGATSPPA